MNNSFVAAGRRYGEVAGNIFVQLPKNCSPQGVQIYFDEFAKQICARRKLLECEGATESEIRAFIHAAFEGMRPFVGAWLIDKTFDEVFAP
jgi:hypothetical protein